MKLPVLVVCGSMLLTSCVSTASASARFGSEAQQLDVASSTTVTTPRPENIVVLSGPVRYEDEDGVYSIRAQWNHELSHPDFDLGASSGLDLTLVPHVESSLSLEERFEVSGSLLLDATTTTCTSKWISQECGVVSVTDAAVVGTAVLRDATIFLTLDWRRFGPSKRQAKASMRIARWAGGSRSDSLGEVELFDVSEALETAGIVGREFQLDVANHKPKKISGRSVWGSGEGVIELVPASR